jgi:hypothetical protein
MRARRRERQEKGNREYSQSPLPEARHMWVRCMFKADASDHWIGEACFEELEPAHWGPEVCAPARAIG